MKEAVTGIYISLEVVSQRHKKLQLLNTVKEIVNRVVYIQYL